MAPRPRRVPFAIPEPPEQRPTPLTGRRRAAMLRYLAARDAKLADEEGVKHTWRKVAKRMLASYIKKAAERDLDDVIEDLVGRVCFVAENRSWAQEILDMAREHWERYHQETDPLHRPQYRFTRAKPRPARGHIRQRTPRRVKKATANPKRSA